MALEVRRLRSAHKLKTAMFLWGIFDPICEYWKGPTRYVGEYDCWDKQMSGAAAFRDEDSAKAAVQEINAGAYVRHMPAFDLAHYFVAGPVEAASPPARMPVVYGKAVGIPTA